MIISKSQVDLAINFFIYIGDSDSGVKLTTISTCSTNLVIRIYDNKSVLLDFITGVKYVDREYINKSVKVKEEESFFLIIFEDSTDLEVEDNLDTFPEDEIYKDLIQVYMIDWKLSKIRISKDLIKVEDMKEIIYARH
jgi:hypothetical protein